MKLSIEISYDIVIPSLPNDLPSGNRQAVWYEQHMERILQEHSDKAEAYYYTDIKVSANPCVEKEDKEHAHG